MGFLSGTRFIKLSDKYLNLLSHITKAVNSK